MLIFFGAFFIFSSFKNFESENERVAIGEIEQRVNESINKEIQTAYAHKKIFKSKTIEVGEKTKNDFKESAPREVVEDKYEINVFKNEAPQFSKKNPETATEKLMALMESEGGAANRKDEMIQSYKKELIERARRAGWEIEINDNLEVVSAERL